MLVSPKAKIPLYLLMRRLRLGFLQLESRFLGPQKGVFKGFLGVPPERAENPKNSKKNPKKHELGTFDLKNALQAPENTII